MFHKHYADELDYSFEEFILLEESVAAFHLLYYSSKPKNSQVLTAFSNIGDQKIQQLGPKVWEIVGEQQETLKISGKGRHA